MDIRLQGPLTREALTRLNAGDSVLYSGTLYTARDAAHRRFAQALARGEGLPFDLAGAIIYYAGPAPARPGAVIGSAGPTTSGRMDAYTPALLDRGLLAMVGKGARSAAVAESIRKNGAAYFVTFGGAAALIARCVVKNEPVCYEDLGAEAVHRLEVVDFPMLTAIDSRGNNYYELGPAAYLKARAAGASGQND